MPHLTAQMPSALRAAARWERLGEHRVPVMLAHPDWDSMRRVPVVLWIHGRTVNKETDPGRYLRWMRSGIGACAIDLPGHGERSEAGLQEPGRTLDIVEQMGKEIDSIVEALGDLNVFDMDRIGIGGMSAGGMATIMRLIRPHVFRCASVEATSGSWARQKSHAAFRDLAPEIFHAKNPIENLEQWQEIPFQAIHAKGDEWVPFESQREFIEALRSRYNDPSVIEFVEYGRTGAPFEHVGFGRLAADAKNRQVEFFRRWLKD